MKTPAPREPIVGRTYTLRGGGADSARFYETLHGLGDECLRRWPDLDDAIAGLRRAGRTRRGARLLAARARAAMESPAAFALAEGERVLSSVIGDVEAHRASLPLRERLGALGTTREQYLLFLLEVELTNRRNRARFLSCASRIALLPHCLRDLEQQCRARSDGFDSVCAGCSARCDINAASTMLRRAGVTPYIWLRADLARLLRRRRHDPGGFGVLGIACIPELVHGLRRCERGGVPAVGLPLDANRCVRWLGEFRPTAVNLNELRGLLGL